MQPTVNPPSETSFIPPVRHKHKHTCPTRGYDQPQQTGVVESNAI